MLLLLIHTVLTLPASLHRNSHIILVIMLCAIAVPSWSELFLVVWATLLSAIPDWSKCPPQILEIWVPNCLPSICQISLVISSSRLFTVISLILNSSTIRFFFNLRLCVNFCFFQQQLYWRQSSHFFSRSV